MVQVHVGTSGYNHRQWEGSFYPRGLSPRKMLSHYGERLNAVELNNTFYRVPKSSVLSSWADEVPDGFRFSLKASRKITHFTRLRPQSLDPTRYLLHSAATLGRKLGAILFQLPPNLRKNAPRLARFLDALPDGAPVAFEFRNDSWRSAEVHDLLREKKVPLVCTDTDATATDEPIVATASWGYLRLRRDRYDLDDLERWVAHIRRTGWERVHVFFKHESHASGPLTAERFREILDGAIA
jgi:uncharacterized protein YecE (DUF72 family)